MKKLVALFAVLIMFVFAFQSVASTTFESPISPVGTPVPTHTLEIENLTGSQVCFNLMDSGIGMKCFGDGRHTYGTFPAGGYYWFIAESPCRVEGHEMAGYGDYQPYSSIMTLRCPKLEVQETPVKVPIEVPVEIPVILLPETGGTL